jgi:hypothetical protein
VAQVGKGARERHERRDVPFGGSAREQNPHWNIMVDEVAR